MVNSTEGNQTAPQEALAKYLGSNINEHAGLGIENLSWNSKFVDASVKGTERKEIMSQHYLESKL